MATKKQAPQTAPRLFTIPDACKQLSCSRSSIYRLLDAGRLKDVKLGRGRRITAESINALVDGGTNHHQS